MRLPRSARVPCGRCIAFGSGLRPCGSVSLGLDVFRVSPILVGALAAAEPLGAIAIGIPLSIGWIRLDGRRALLRGSLLFLIGLAAMAYPRGTCSPLCCC